MRHVERPRHDRLPIAPTADFATDPIVQLFQPIADLFLGLADSAAQVTPGFPTRAGRKQQSGHTAKQRAYEQAQAKTPGGIAGRGGKAHGRFLLDFVVALDLDFSVVSAHLSKLPNPSARYNRWLA